MIALELEQYSPGWWAVRLGLPTASRFKDLLTATGAPSKSTQAYAEYLAGCLYAGKDIDEWQGNQYTDRGTELEQEARLAYAMSGGEVQEIGFCTDADGRYGASPDGLVGDDGVLEIKCLPRKHISMLLYWDKHKKVPPEFRAQVQGQLLVTGRNWCDLMFYHPDLPQKIIRVEPDQEYQEKLIKQIYACLDERDRISAVLEGM